MFSFALALKAVCWATVQMLVERFDGIARPRALATIRLGSGPSP